MIKGIFHLANDVTARAGEYLIMREDDFIAVVSREDLDNLFKPKAVEAPAPVVVADDLKAAKEAKRALSRSKPFGYYATAESLEAAKARGRHMADVRKQRLDARKLDLARQALAQHNLAAE